MASLMQQGERFYCQFLYNGKRHCFSLGKVGEDEANAKVNQADYLLMRLKQGLLQVPPGLDIVAFLEFDGKVPEHQVATRQAITLGELRDRYLEVHRGSLEATTTNGMELHFRHLVTTLGAAFPMPTLTLDHLQQHADRRLKAKWRGGRLSPATIRKELVTLRTAWNWAVLNKWVTDRFPPLKRVKLGKPEEKPPFQTWAEIERAIKLGGDHDALWDALFLQLPEIDLLLRHVKEHAVQPWVYPMFCFAAHTGARRSEMIRAQIADVDFTGATILVHEKKRAHDRRTTRRVPLTTFLAGVLKDWLKIHPGGPHLFAQPAKVVRSKNKRATATPVTRDEAHDHFKRTLADSKWKVMRGWHILRHSFASNCAARGTDQRLLDAWLGHTTEIRKRYLHLIPSNEQQAIQSVFG